MSYQLIFNYGQEGEVGFQVASSAGWPEFCDWVDELDEDLYPDLVQLCEDGWGEEIEPVVEQIESASASFPPDRDGVEATGQQLIKLLSERIGAGDESFIVSGGD